MKLKEKQEKVVNYILTCDNLYEEVLWLVEQLEEDYSQDIEEVYDYIFENEEGLIFKPEPIPGT